MSDTHHGCVLVNAVNMQWATKMELKVEYIQVKHQIFPVLCLTPPSGVTS